MFRIIDRAVFTTLGATGLYLFFLGAWDSVPLAAGLAFACEALLRGILRARPPRKRPSRASLRAELLRLSGLPDAEAQAELTALVRTRWPEEDFDLVPVLKHPEATLSSGDLLNAWKGNRASARLVVCATCPAEPRALTNARELKDPAVAVVDSRALSRLLRRTLPPDAPAPLPSPRQRLRSLIARVGESRVTPRNALLAGALLVMYLRGGNPLCLFGALAMLAHMGVAIARRRVGKRLFET